MSDPEKFDVHLAEQIQQLLLPKAPPVCDWCCIGVKNQMAAGVGGDFFDFLPTVDGCQLVMIGDVTGHGVAASVVMSLLYGYIHRSIEEVCSPFDVARRVNDFLIKFATRSPLHDHYFSSTLFIGVLVPDTLEMHYVNAAHPPPLVRRGNTLIELAASAPQIGFFDLPDNSLRSFRFQKNDRLFLYTDGITETANPRGEVFGVKPLKRLLLASTGDHLAFLDALYAELMRFNGEEAPGDDCSAIVLDFHGSLRK